MKKLLSVLLLSAIIVGSLSFSSYAADNKKGYTAGIGSSYLMDIGNSIDEAYYNFSDGRKISIENINDENLIVLDKPYVSDSKSGKAKNNSTLSLTIDAANLTYKAINRNYNGVGLPEAINVGSNLSSVYFGFRIKIEDNSPAFLKSTSTMRISLVSEIDKLTPLTSGYGHYFYWLDLTDGSMTIGHPQSGYMPANKNRNPNSRMSGVEFTGDMDGYILIPLQSLSGESTMITKANLQKTFKNIMFEFRTGDTDVDGNAAKKSSWEGKTVFLGDGFLVNSIEDFAGERCYKRKKTGSMYSPIVSDTASYAMRVAGYRSFDQVRVGDAFGKKPLDPNDNTPEIQSSRQFVHITTLPNGDRARELILNSKNNSTVVDSSGKPYTSGDAMLSMYDNYDLSKIDTSGGINKHGVRTKGVPSEIDLSGVEYLAFRIATRDGDVKNEKVEFSIRLAPADSPSSASTQYRTVSYYLTEGNVTYLDMQTLKSKTISVSGGNKDKLITVNGNLDGYLIIPIDRFNTKSDGSGTALDQEVIRGCWGAYYNYGNQGIYYCLKSGFENGKAFYAGDIFFVSNKEEFISVRTTDCASIGHKAVEVDEVPATCQDEGVSKGKKCSVCDMELRGFTTLSKAAHSYKLSQTVAPSGNSEGYEIYTCEVCNSRIKKTSGEKIEDTTSSESESDNGNPEQDPDNPANDDDSQQEQDEPQNSDNLMLIIIIIIIAVLVVGGIVLTVLLLRKKKK